MCSFIISRRIQNLSMSCLFNRDTASISLVRYLNCTNNANKIQKNNDQEKERGVQRKKTLFPFVEDLKRFYAGFMKVAFELSLEGYHAIYGLK